MASKLIKLTDSNGNLLIPAVVSQAVQVKNGTTPVDLQTAYEGIQSQISAISLAEAEGLGQSLTYDSYISQPANNKISYYLIDGSGHIKTNVFTINDVAHASAADDATNASKLTTGKLTYNGTTGALTYNFGDGDKNVSILGTSSAYGFVKLGTGAGHAATGNHTHTTSVNQSTAVITAGGTSTGAIKGNTSSYGFVKFDTNPTNNSTNAVTSSYIYNSYQYVKEQLSNKAPLAHVHNLYGHNESYTGDAGNSVNVMIGFVDATIQTSGPNGSPAQLSYYSYSVPTQKYVDDTFLTKSEFETFSTSGMHYMGSTGTQAFNPATKTAGDVYIVGLKGHGNSSSEVGDFIVYNGTSWDIWDKNVTGAMYHGTTALTTGNIVLTDGTDGKVTSVSPPSVSVVTNINKSGTIFPVGIKHLFNNSGTDLPFLGYNGGVVTRGMTAQGSAYIGITYTPDHTGSGTAGKLLYWETASKHSALASTYGYDNNDNIGLMHIAGGVPQNMLKSSGSSSIPTYVAAGYIRPVTSIDDSLLPEAVFENSAKAKFASKDGNTVYTYISPTGNSDATNGSVLKFVQGNNVTITRNADDQITISSSDTADHIFNSNSTNTNHVGQNSVDPYLKIWGPSSSGSALRFTGSQGIKVESITNGTKLQISHTFSDAAVVTAADLTHITYYYEATNVTVDDFSLYTFDNTKKYLEGISTTNTTHAYIKGS